MNSFDEIVNSCRICRCEYNDEFVELLCNETLTLSGVGQLYEELLGLKINLETFKYLPQYLCKSCDLQISLFGELKAKALDTASLLGGLGFYQNDIVTNDTYSTEPTCEPEEHKEFVQIKECNNLAEQWVIDSTAIEETAVDCIVDADIEEENFETISESNELPAESLDENFANDESCDSTEKLEDTESTGLQTDTDYVDVFYLDDALIQSNDLVDTNSNVKKVIIQKKYIRTKMKETYPCNECSKKFKTAESRQAHINVAHLNVPAYQCNLCPKTFNQKVHYRYHMNRHNNLRKFKCEICEKAFLSKTDLSIHMRFHRGERPYKCEICGKDYLLMQHLKGHMYSHNPNPSIMCNICNSLFISPTTLRTHMLTIHERPRFKCEYCVKRFRRKHHLVSHTKVHEKQFKKCDEEIKQNPIEEENINCDNFSPPQFNEDFQNDCMLRNGDVENNMGEMYNITYSYEDFNTENYNEDDGYCENGQDTIFY